MSDEKYVVFKKEDWDRWHLLEEIPEQLKDAIVIRAQDQFASAALGAYADQVLNFLDMAESFFPDSLDDDTRGRLLGIADYFRGWADEARHVNKLPD